MDLSAEIERLAGVLKSARLLDGSAGEVLELARAYCSDARHFLGKGERDDALEAYAIAWAYVDALLHLGLVEVQDLSLFTVE